MEKLPEHLIQKIFLKLPATCLCNLRCVSKYFWCLITNPTFINLHLHLSPAQLFVSSYRIVHYRYKCGMLGFKPITHNYACNFPTTSTSASASASAPEIVEMHCPFEPTEIIASCNGLFLCIDGKRDDYFPNYIWNPFTKEYKELPPPPPPLLLNGVDVGFLSTDFESGFCGFGYDRKNDEYKILHYENRVDRSYIDHGQYHGLNLISSVIEFKLYTLGTNTWTCIADNPYRSFFFRESSERTGLFANGALHWIMSFSDPASKGKIISFDIEKEVFGEVQKPRYYPKEDWEEEHNYAESLQILQECLCMCQVRSHGEDVKIDIWMLHDYNNVIWTKLFRVVIPMEEFDFDQFRLLRYCENGEILMLRNRGDVVVYYDPVNHKARCAKKFNESIAKGLRYYMDYTESLVRLNSGTYT